MDSFAHILELKTGYFFSSRPGLLPRRVRLMETRRIGETGEIFAMSSPVPPRRPTIRVRHSLSGLSRAGLRDGGVWRDEGVDGMRPGNPGADRGGHSAKGLLVLGSRKIILGKTSAMET